MPTLLTDSEAADLLRLTSRQVAKLAKTGQLPVVRLPGNEVRFDLADLERFVQEHKEPVRAALAKLARGVYGAKEQQRS